MNEKLVNAMADLDEDGVLSEVKAQKENGTPVLDIIADLQEGMGVVGNRFEKRNTFYLNLLCLQKFLMKLLKSLEDWENLQDQARVYL